MAIEQKSILMSLKLTIVPVLFLICFTCIEVSAQKVGRKTKKIAIDAGHGGKVPGSVGRVFYEKDIALGVSLRLGKLVQDSLPDIEVVYTRKNDIEVGLHERAEIANKAEVDLFISIHTNAVENRSVIGYETWIMGTHKSKEILEAAMLENSVIEYEDGYQEIYDGFEPNSPEAYIIFSLMQNTYKEKSIQFAELVQEELRKCHKNSNDRGLKQGPLLVLLRTAAPSVLIEVGFISNIEEEKRLGDIDVQQEIAESIYNAIKRYKKNYMDIAVSPNVEIKQQNTKIENNKTNDEEAKKVKFPATTYTPSSNTQPKNYKWITQ